jgi:hypothetical protein
MSGPADLPAEAIEAMRATRAFQAGAAFGVPENARDDYLRALLAAALPHIRAHIAGRQQAVIDRMLSRLDRDDNAAERHDHDLIADLGPKLIAVARGGDQDD